MPKEYFLSIETATAVCSVALSEGGRLIAGRVSNEAYTHSKVLTVFIDEVLKDAGLKPASLSAIVVSIGPGSYTGLRIGASVAKGLAYALDIPVVTVPTLLGMAYGMKRRVEKMPDLDDYLLKPMIDARRMEVYSMELDKDFKTVRDTETIILDETVFEKYTKPVVVASDNIAKIKQLTDKFPLAVTLDDFMLDAADLLPAGIERYNKREFADVAYFTPFYFKEFIAGIPKVKGL